MKKQVLFPILCASLMMFSASIVCAQEAGAAAPATTETMADLTPNAPASDVVDNSAPAAKTENKFMTILFGSGTLAAILWFSLFGALGFYVYLVIDSSIVVRASKIMPQSLINEVEEAMKEGDVVKALQCCEKEPGPMANILSAAFNHVEEGYEVIQESIETAADLEVERIMQKLTWFSVNGNISPMLGLLGTVMGMIMAFENLGTGQPDIGMLAITISFSLWTTAAGLCVAIPCIATYYIFRNNASRIVLRMEAITMELVKGLRNVQVVTE